MCMEEKAGENLEITDNTHKLMIVVKVYVMSRENAICDSRISTVFSIVFFSLASQ